MTDAGARPRNISLSRSDFSHGDAFNSSEEDSGSDDELDLNDRDIPVTGFAVASNKRNADFHELFPNIPEGDYLIEDYGCALQREILIQGRLYISENHICFHANIFGWITDLSIPIYEITALEKKMTAFVIPNAIQITTRQAKYTFASFLSRDTTYDVITNIWRLARPEDSLELPNSHNTSSRDMTSTVSISDESGKEPAPGAGLNKVTQCSCSKNDGHLNEVALETVLPGTPDKIYNLMFASGFIKDFMKVDQKLIDVQISDWAPISPGSKLLQRNMSYTKPLYNSVGPKQTKCEIHDEAVFCDFEGHVVMLTTTKTPDVPSGGVFAVKTRTCLMWASSISTRVIVTTQVEWTGRSFIKGLIEKSAIEGQKVYHSDLDKAMRMYIQEHQSEFVPEGLDPTAIAPVEPITPVVEPNGGGLDAAISGEEARKARERDRNRRGLQWAYDTFDGAYNVARRSTTGALELVKEAWDQSSSTTILWFIIVLLVFSNLWTLMLVGKREEVGRRKEAKRAEEREQWVQGVVTGIWEELAAERSRPGTILPVPTGPVGDLQTEVANIGKALDMVEERVQAIRESLNGLS
ncbi:GRAM-domain-containing protein [Gyrodon lividus]|nr:GRAM-domain-containing protein [Gyrodon lividus]